MAGISAGHSLTQQDITDFKIIEFQDRIGGRTLHQKFGRKSDGSQYTVELGTNWVCLELENLPSSFDGLFIYYDRSQACTAPRGPVRIKGL